MATESSILHSGEVLGGFRVDELIGIGGTAVVYRAEQISLGRPVALKVLSNKVARDDVFRERFRREAKHLAAFEHPNIVPVHEAGEHNGLLYLAMRLVEGTNLAELILDQRLSADGTIDILRPIAGALDAAHAEGLIHRDVKPQNVLITERGHPYLADFGVAKGSNTHGLTATGGFVGTVNYASPEQIRGSTLTVASDIYALTAVLYHCLTGEVPYPRESDVAVMHAHLHEPPPVLPGESGRDDELRAVIARGMAKEPDARYGYAWELLVTAAQAVSQMPPTRREAIPAFPTRAGEDPALVEGRSKGDASSRPDPGPTAADRRRRTYLAPDLPATPPARRRLLTAAVAGGLLLVLASVGFIVFGSSAKTIATRPEERDLTASLTPATIARLGLAERRSRSTRSLSDAEQRLAAGDTEAATLLSRLSSGAHSNSKSVAALTASLRQEASTMQALANAAAHGDRSAYAHSLAEIPPVQTGLARALQDVKSLGFRAPSLLDISAHTLTLPAPRHHSAHHAARSTTKTAAASKAKAVSSTAPATAPTVSGAPTEPAPTQKYVAPPAVSHPAPTHSSSSPKYAPTVVAPPVE